jgi:hypothetical protein
MAWRKQSPYRLVAADDARELTGLSAAELLVQRDTQRLTRIDEHGIRREYVRVPVDLLLVQQDEEQ